MTTSKNSSNRERRSSQQNRISTDTLTEDINRVAKLKWLIALLIIFMMFDYMTKNYLFNLSVQHELIIRTEYRSDIYDLIFHYISELGDKYAVGLSVYLAFHTLDGCKSFILLVQAIMCQSFSHLLKAIYHEPRPFFVSDIKPNTCRFEYGNPSGHSQICLGLYITFWDLLCRQYKVSRATRIMTLIPIIILIIMIGFSRIYNGVHTYNQVLSGYIWGLISYFAICHVFYFEICMWLNRLTQKTVYDLVWNTLTQTFVISNAVAISLYYFNQNFHPIPNEWFQAMERNCVKMDGINIHPDLQNMIQFNFIWGILGAYFGILIDQKYTGMKIYPYFFNTSLIVTIKRLLLCSVIGVLTQLPGFLVSKRNPVWMIILFKTVMPITVGAIYIFGFNKILAHKYGLINTADSFKLKQEKKIGAHKANKKQK